MNDDLLKRLLNFCFSLAVHGERKIVFIVNVSFAPIAKHGSRIRRVRFEFKEYLRLEYVASLTRRAR